MHVAARLRSLYIIGGGGESPRALKFGKCCVSENPSVSDLSRHAGQECWKD